MKPYYDDGSCVIYHGDCREVLPSIAPIAGASVVTSPPYNKGADFSGGSMQAVSRASKGSRFFGGYGECPDAMPMGEYEDWQRDVLASLWAWTGSSGTIFYNHKPRVIQGLLWTPLALNPGLPLRQIIVWDTGVGVNLHPGAFAPACEWVLFFAAPDVRLSERKSTSAIGDVWRIQPSPSVDGHPAPFPIGLPSRAIAATDAEVILDPFAGTGTTLRAAKDLGRKAIGIEIEERYCEIAAQRLGQEVLDLGAAA